MEGRAVLFIAGAFICVVFVVQKASDVRQRTFLRRNPQVGAARVKDHFEALRWCSDRNNSEVLRVW